MNADREFLFLSELRYLSDAELRHAEAIERLAATWPEARESAVSYAADRRTSRKPQKERDADREQFQEAVAVLVHKQGEFVMHLEATLAVLGRLSLVLFPQGEDSHPQRHERAEQLRAVLQIDDRHSLRDRLFRNKWFHHDEVLDDEVLDDLPESFQHAQRFTSRERITDADQQTCIRLCLIDDQTVIHAIAGEFNIPSVADDLRELEQRIDRAINTWADRDAAELRISGDDV